MGSSFAPCVDIGRTHDGPVRSRTYAARLPRPDAPILTHLRQYCADAANRLLNIGILQAVLGVEARMGGAERERFGNDMHAHFAEHDLPRKLGFHAAEQSG